MGNTNLMDSLFNPPVVEEIKAQENNTKSRDVNMFAPNAMGLSGSDDSKEYVAVVRFVPNYENPAKSIIQKETAWLHNRVTDEMRQVDSPASINERCPIKNMFFKLYKSEHEQDKEAAKKYFSVRRNYYALVQVLSDKVNKENNGKILVWKFGQKIYEKIMEEMDPESIKSHSNPFSPLDGRYFYVKVTVKNKFNNYDSCSFLDKVPNINRPELIYFDESGQITGYADANEPAALMEYLKNNSPKLSEYEFKPWTPETQQFVDDVFAAFSDPDLFRKLLEARVLSNVNTPTVSPFENSMNMDIPPVTQPKSSQVQQSPTNIQQTQSLIGDIRADMNSANKTTNKGSEDFDGLNFDDILATNTNSGNSNSRQNNNSNASNDPIDDILNSLI